MSRTDRPRFQPRNGQKSRTPRGPKEEAKGCRNGPLGRNGALVRSRQRELPAEGHHPEGEYSSAEQEQRGWLRGGAEEGACIELVRPLCWKEGAAATRQWIVQDIRTIVTCPGERQ